MSDIYRILEYLNELDDTSSIRDIAQDLEMQTHEVDRHVQTLKAENLIRVYTKTDALYF